jgi:hypothetical protein
MTGLFKAALPVAIDQARALELKIRRALAQALTENSVTAASFDRLFRQ